MAGCAARRTRRRAVRPPTRRARRARPVDRPVDAPVEPLCGRRRGALGGVVGRGRGGRRGRRRAARVGTGAGAVPGTFGGASARDAADGAAAGRGRCGAAVRPWQARCHRRAAARRHGPAAAVLDLGCHLGERLRCHSAGDTHGRRRAAEPGSAVRGRRGHARRLAAAHAAEGDAADDRSGVGRSDGGGLGTRPRRVRRHGDVRRQSRRANPDAAARRLRRPGVGSGTLRSPSASCWSRCPSVC